jgi:hypothetical protein
MRPKVNRQKTSFLLNTNYPGKSNKLDKTVILAKNSCRYKYLNVKILYNKIADSQIFRILIRDLPNPVWASKDLK